jgi:hypothetical protein
LDLSFFGACGPRSGGGSFESAACSSSAESSDGRSVFSAAPNGQLKMPRLGNFCVSMVGEGAAQSDVALGADVSATSSNAQHAARNAVDGDAQSFWASGFDPASSVDMQVDLGATKQIKAVEIDWEHPAQARSLMLVFVFAHGMEGVRVCVCVCV